MPSESFAKVEMTVDLESEVDPRIRTRTACGDPDWSNNAMSCQRSPASLPNTQRSHRLEALIRVPVQVQGNFLAIWWLPSLQWGEWGFETGFLAFRWFAESAAGIKHWWSDLLWEVEIKEISRPDTSKAGKAYVHIDLNQIHQWGPEVIGI